MPLDRVSPRRTTVPYFVHGELPPPPHHRPGLSQALFRCPGGEEGVSFWRRPRALTPSGSATHHTLFLLLSVTFLVCVCVLGRERSARTAVPKSRLGRSSGRAGDAGDAADCRRSAGRRWMVLIRTSRASLVCAFRMGNSIQVHRERNFSNRGAASRHLPCSSFVSRTIQEVAYMCLQGH